MNATTLELIYSACSVTLAQRIVAGRTGLYDCTEDEWRTREASGKTQLYLELLHE